MCFGKDVQNTSYVTSQEESLLVNNLSILIEGLKFLENNEKGVVEDPEEESERLFLIMKTRHLFSSWRASIHLSDPAVQWIQDHPDIFLQALELYGHYRRPKDKYLMRRLRGIFCKFNNQKEGVS